MTDFTLRFVHGSDFHLEQPLAGVADVPDALRATLVDATYLATEAVFATAVDRRVDFVVLTGDLLDPRAAGPRGLAFLVEQFERLDAAGIAVYWLASELDAAELWPASVDLPPNVRHLDAGRGECIVHWRDGKSVARIGPLAALPLRREGDERLFTIGVARGTPRIVPGEAPFDYLALGGEHERHILHSGNPWVVQAGSPQGRSIANVGPHGSTLVEVDAERHVRVALRTCDAVRWREEQISLDECQHRARWESVLRERVAAATAEAGDRAVLMRLRLMPGGNHIGRSQRERLAAEVLAWMRETFSGGAPAVWTVGVEHEPALVDAAAREQDTILGEFLRTVDALGERSDDGLQLAQYAGATTLVDDLAARLDVSTAQARDPLLRHVAELGRELLGGEASAAGLAMTGAKTLQGTMSAV